MTTVLPQTTITASAGAGDRTLYLYYTHTKETGRFTFKRNGQFDKKVLSDLNYFLRDWRRNEPAKMDPNLFDLIWEVYQEVGATQPIHIVSAYRSPKTNQMLRAKSSGVAENSQHTKGHAMDFFIPGINLTTLRATAMKRQVGGVGYYPTSGSPFVHLDTGNVRAWPRMTRAQLQKVFPDGRTLHLPAEGKPLSEEGRRYAQAQWQKCRAVPCGGRATTRLASNDSGNDRGGPTKTLASMLFSGKGSQQAGVQLASTGPVDREVKTFNVAPPVPMARRDGAPVQTANLEQPVTDIPFSTSGSAPLGEELLGTAGGAPMPARKSAALMAATGLAVPDAGGETAVLAIAALDASAPVPASRAQMTQQADQSDMLTAYAPPQDPEAQRALRMIIERETTASIQTPQPAPQQRQGLSSASTKTASLGGNVGLDAFKSIFDSTWSAVGNPAPGQQPIAKALAEKAAALPYRGFETRQTELTAPDFEHVADIFAQPMSVHAGQFAVMFAHDESDFSPATELGAHSGNLAFSSKPGFERNSDRFVKGPILVTVR